MRPLRPVWLVHSSYGVQTLQTGDTSDPRHFGSSAELSRRHIGTGTKVSRHLGTDGTEVSGHIGTDVLQILTGDTVIHKVVFQS